MPEGSRHRTCRRSAALDPVGGELEDRRHVSGDAQQRPQVAELEVAVDRARPAVAQLGDRHREVECDRGLADSALGANNESRVKRFGRLGSILGVPAWSRVMKS